MESTTLDRAKPEDERCLCGSLLARIDEAGVEILCRRCKRIHRIHWPGGEMASRRIMRKAVPTRS